MTMRLPFYMINAFTTEPFKGNPAAICLTDKALDEATMQSIATELDVSETAFLLKTNNDSYDIRYFSPKMEIPLCGHATLAAASVLFKLNEEQKEIQFRTIEKLILHILRTETGISMELPKYATTLTNAPRPLLDALSIKNIVQARFNKETKILMLEIEDENILKSLQPDKNSLLKSHQGIHGVLITAKSSTKDFDFSSRYFWPWSGTLEDHVTGATHTFLAPYWGEKLNKTRLRSFQCSKRTGYMDIEIQRSTVQITGQTVLFFEGEIMI